MGSTWSLKAMLKAMRHSTVSHIIVEVRVSRE
jgi:hypothetical protein